ncbi:MAG: hypothetical protein WCW26_02030 [Candidatus Buchananbacteria bacterium]
MWKNLVAVWVFVLARLFPDDQAKAWRAWVKNEGRGRMLGDLLDLLASPEVGNGFKQRAIWLLLAPGVQWYNPCSWGWLLKPCYWPGRIGALDRVEEVLALVKQHSPWLLPDMAKMVCGFAKAMHWRPLSGRVKECYNDLLIELLALCGKDQALGGKIFKAIEAFGRRNGGWSVDYADLNPLEAILVHPEIAEHWKQAAHDAMCGYIKQQRGGFLPETELSISFKYAQLVHELLNLKELPYSENFFVSQFFFLMACPQEGEQLISPADIGRISELATDEEVLVLQYEFALFLTRGNGGPLRLNSEQEFIRVGALAELFSFNPVLAADLEKATKEWQGRVAAENELRKRLVPTIEAPAVEAVPVDPAQESTAPAEVPGPEATQE